MIKSKRESNSHSQRSSKSANVQAATELILDINNIQGRRLSKILSVGIQNIRTVHQLKKAIARRHGLSVQELLYRGVCLGDDRLLAHLLPSMMKIGNSPRFSVRTRLCTSPRPGGVSLFVKGLQGASFQVHLPSQGTIANLKNAIRHYEGYSSEQNFHLTCGGKLLSAENLSLATCNVVSGSLVLVVGRLLGGDVAWGRAWGPPQTFVDMENMDSLRTSKVKAVRSQNLDPAKHWQRITPGLNIRGKCPNVKCIAHGCNVWCRKGYTVYNIAEPVYCPSCRENITATTCKFWACQWMFEGRKTGVFSVDVMSKWHVTSKEEIQGFDDNDGKNTATWSSLIITAKRLDHSGLESEEGVRENCVLCFAPTVESTPLTGNTPDLICGHAVHPECAREYVRAGYKTCPMCRLPLYQGTMEQLTTTTKYRSS